MTPVGIVVSLLAIFVSMVMNHGKVGSIINVPSMILVFGGTIGVSLAGLKRDDWRSIRGGLRTALAKRNTWTATEFSEHLIEASRDARRQGLNVLENGGLPEVEVDPFVRTGVELIVATSDPERVRAVLEAEIVGMETRHQVAIRFFHNMGGFAPTIGILGTVIGLVRVLANLATPSKLGGAIAEAFTATLWGVMTANVFWIPIANKLKRLSDDEVGRKELVIEGLLALQEGLIGRQLRDRIEPFLAPGDRTTTNPTAAGPHEQPETSAA